MALLLPAPRQNRKQDNFSGRPTATWGTLLTGTTTNVEGTVTELVAATTDDTDLVVIDVSEMAASATNTAGLLNIYTGASMTHLIIPNLLVGWSATILALGPPRTYQFPLRIPRGTRIGASLRSVVASDTAYVRISLLKTGNWAGGKCEAVGADTATSRGTSVTPGTTSDGTWTTLGTTGFNWRWATVASIGNADATLNVGTMSLELGVGSALLPTQSLYRMHDNGSEWQSDNLGGVGRHADIASGATLQARLRHSGTAEAHFVTAYGIG